MATGASSGNPPLGPPPPTSATSPAYPAAIPPSGGPTPAPAPPAREGTILDEGAVSRDSVRARRWKARGVVKVLGRVDADEVDLAGTASLAGPLTAGRMSAAGSVDVEGPTAIEGSLSLDGRARFAGSLDAAELSGKGSIRSSGPVKVSGVLRFQGEVMAPELSAGRLVLEGGLKIRGTASAEVMDIELLQTSTVGLLRAPVLRVHRKPGPPIAIPFLSHPPPSLEALRIEGGDVELEGVTTEFLRGDRISLGPGCHVVRVEGTIVRQHPKAHVGPESRTPPPHGLTR